MSLSLRAFHRADDTRPFLWLSQFIVAYPSVSSCLPTLSVYRFLSPFFQLKTFPNHHIMDPVILKLALKVLRSMNWLSRRLLEVSFVLLRLQEALFQYVIFEQEQAPQSFVPEEQQVEEKAALNFVEIPSSPITSDQE